MGDSAYHLRHDYISVPTDRGVSYGGSQSFSEGKVMRHCGCGVVAALDWLLYLQKRTPTARVSFLPPTDVPLDRTQYTELLYSLSRKYLPMLYPTGINGLMLAAGINLLFLREHLPYRASWRMSRNGLWSGMKEMLAGDYPVILSVGPNFPRLLSGKEKATLFQRDPQGTLRPSAAVHAHYMTVTALEGDWLRLSSWGKEYWLNITAYEDYIRTHSSYVLSNILYIEEK